MLTRARRSNSSGGKPGTDGDEEARGALLDVANVLAEDADGRRDSGLGWLSLMAPERSDALVLHWNVVIGAT